jgi:hypothetical protein
VADTVPPDNRTAGDAGHIDDHNNIADVLTSLSEAVSLLPGTKVTVSAVAPVAPGNNDIFFNTSGGTLTVEVWSASANSWIVTILTNVPKASDFGLLAESFDLMTASGSAAAVSQVVYLQRLTIHQPILISNVWCAIATAGSGPVAGENQAGLISCTTGKLLSSGLIPSASITATGPVSTALAVPQTVSSNCWTAHVFNCTTPPALLRGIPFAFLANLNLPVSGYQTAVNGTSATTLPGTITASSNTQTGAITFWTGAS